MPNQRAEDKVGVNFLLHEDVITKMDAAARRLSLDRSQFIRDAIEEKLASVGVMMDREKFLPPARTKPRAVRYKITRTNSKPASVSTKLGTQAAAAARRHDPES